MGKETHMDFFFKPEFHLSVITYSIKKELNLFSCQQLDLNGIYKISSRMFGIQLLIR